MALTGLIAGLALAIAQQDATPDPAAWWSPEVPRPPAVLDPLGGRRWARDERPIPINNGVDPLLYRLWGLPPLQSQIVRDGEQVVEAWARPSGDVRQAVIRITVRRDGRAFMQARAGLGCCTPENGRRVDINAELPPSAVSAMKALALSPAWSQPQSVTVDYGGGAVSAVCVNGVSWDVTLLVPGQARHLRRACDDAEIGSIAPELMTMVGAALGHDARFDAAVPRRSDFTRQAAAYGMLLQSGGRLVASDRPQPPPVAAEPAPDGMSHPLRP